MEYRCTAHLKPLPQHKALYTLLASRGGSVYYILFFFFSTEWCYPRILEHYYNKSKPGSLVPKTRALITTNRHDFGIRPCTPLRVYASFVVC